MSTEHSERRAVANTRFSLQFLKNSTTISKFTRNRRAVVGLVIVLVVLASAALAPVLATHDPFDVDPLSARQGPGGGHFLGTDVLGRDIYSRILYGARIAVIVGVVPVAFAIAIGGSGGLLAGHFGGILDSIVMRTADVVLAFPTLLLAIAILAALGTGLVNVIIALTLTRIPIYARLVRSSALQIREYPYVDAARAGGSTEARVLIRHVAPACIAPVIVQSSLHTAELILAESTLSFLGLGIAPPNPSWGAMIDIARPALRTEPHMMLFPGLAILILLLSINLAGDGLRDALDPRTVHKN